jgi:hypothetical protein
MTPTARRRLSAAVLGGTIAASIATSPPPGWQAEDSLYIIDLVLDEEMSAVGFTAEVDRKRPPQTPRVTLSFTLQGSSDAETSALLRIYELSEPWNGAVDADLQPILPDDAQIVTENLVRGAIGDEPEQVWLSLHGADIDQDQDTAHLVLALEDGHVSFDGHLEVTASVRSDDAIPKDAIKLDLIIDAGPGEVSETSPEDEPTEAADQ